MPVRMLYVARHAEPDEDGDLSATGRAQAEALGARLAGVGLAAIHHGPLPRVARTAAIVAAHCPGVPVLESEAAGDYPPSIPEAADLPAPYEPLVAQYDPAEQARGPLLAAEAVRRFLAPPHQDVRELVVTHNFLAAWLVRAALDGPSWRWLGLNFAHAALAVIRVSDGFPPSLVTFNDMTHLPNDLRWTGFPAAAIG